MCLPPQHCHEERSGKLFQFANSLFQFHSKFTTTSICLNSNKIHATIFLELIPQKELLYPQQASAVPIQNSQETILV